MTLTLSFGLNIQLRTQRRARSWNLPIISKTVQLTRQAATPGRLAVVATVASIVVSSLIWGLR